MNVKTMGDEYEQIMEYCFCFNLKNQKKGSQLVFQLRAAAGVHQVNLFFDEDSKMRNGASA